MIRIIFVCLSVRYDFENVNANDSSEMDATLNLDAAVAPYMGGSCSGLCVWFVFVVCFV